ncbi:MAG: PEP-CTERM sorting domain-containing protein, partial [Betaproteobacteria bacterium]
VVKADNGTYGMGIMTVRDAKELDEINRRTRNKMSVVKDGQEVTEVIIQEGVPTYERMNDAVAEPVVYMIDRYVVGGFYRVHAERGIDENLNAPGASFVPLAFGPRRRDLRVGPGDGGSPRGAYANLTLPGVSFSVGPDATKASNAGEFYGLAVNTNIAYAVLSGNSHDYVFVDNLTVAAAVPEPETYILLGAGVLVVGLAVRRRQQA